MTEGAPVSAQGWASRGGRPGTLHLAAALSLATIVLLVINVRLVLGNAQISGQWTQDVIWEVTPVLGFVAGTALLAVSLWRKPSRAALAAFALFACWLVDALRRHVPDIVDPPHAMIGGYGERMLMASICMGGALVAFAHAHFRERPRTLEDLSDDFR